MGRRRLRLAAFAAVLSMTGALVVPAAASTGSGAASGPGSSTVIDGHARFEVLTPTLIRLEYAGDGHFQDGKTFNVVNRDFPTPAYTTSVEDGYRIIKTSKLSLRYQQNSGPFSPQNTSITMTVAGKQTTAHPYWQTQPCVFGQVCEAELATLGGGAKVANNHQGYTGTGFVAGYTKAGAAATFKLSGVPSNGTYTLHVRYSNYPPGSGDMGKCVPRTLSVYDDGQDVATATFDPTASWDDWAEYRTSLPLTQGSGEITLKQDTDDCGNINVDSIAVTQPGAPMPPAPPAPPAPNSLGGWYRALDGQDEPVPMHPGLLNTDGWYLLDDSQTALWSEGGWAAPRPDHGGEPYQDGYFFGYGHDYQTALQQFAHLTGPAPLLPKAYFGFQFSRYWPYSATDYENTLIPEFRDHHVPLDVLFVDTDWKAPNQWDGWSWNKNLFPNPSDFLAWAHSQGLLVALNTHPSIQGNDPLFPEANNIAGGLTYKGVSQGGDTTYVWDWSNPSHAKSYFWLHQPFEQQGVDFWWLDWCCDQSYVSMNGLTPDTWINYLYAKDLTDKDKRGFVFSRMGASLQAGDGGATQSGPWAEHRYDVHFTGDTYASWDELWFQAYFAQAEGASIGLPYVAHDLGSHRGFRNGSVYIPDDMYARWMQLGTFQPIMRVHAKPEAGADRLPWRHGPAAEASAEKFIRLREALVPYTYTLARAAHDTGLPMLRAMYLDYPDEPNAYAFDHEYLYGPQILVAPIASPGNTASRKMWFPPGEWVDYFTGARYQGPSVQTVTAPLDQMPVFVKAGGIVPEQPSMDHVGADPNAATILRVYSGADGSFRLYDDAGKGLGYQQGQYAWTPITHTQNGDGQQVLRIGAAQGSYPGQPDTRQFQARFVDTSKPVQVLVGNAPIAEVGNGSDATGWWYDDEQHVVHVNLPQTRTGQTVQVALEGAHVASPTHKWTAS